MQSYRLRLQGFFVAASAKGDVESLQLSRTLSINDRMQLTAYYGAFYL